MKIAVIGAGIAGRMVCLEALKHQFDVTLFEQSSFFDIKGCSLTAAGMLAPYCELEYGEPIIAEIGKRSLNLWAQHHQKMDQAFYFQNEGSIIISHRSDLPQQHRLTRSIEHHGYQDQLQRIDRQTLEVLEPALNPNFNQAMFIEKEGQVDPESFFTAFNQQVLPKIKAFENTTISISEDKTLNFDTSNRFGTNRKKVLAPLFQKGQRRARSARNEFIASTNTYLNDTKCSNSSKNFLLRKKEPSSVFSLEENYKRLEKKLSSKGVIYDDFDLIFDCRGLGANDRFPQLRGVRGEVIHLEIDGVNLNRPVRVMHPRYPIYLVPRPGNKLLIGASSIEANDSSPISVRSALDLLSAAYSVASHFGEARILTTRTNCRPATPDNLPMIHRDDRIITLNGLFRHGWLMAPAMAEAALDLVTGRENPFLTSLLKEEL